MSRLICANAMCTNKTDAKNPLCGKCRKKYPGKRSKPESPERIVLGEGKMRYGLGGRLALENGMNSLYWSWPDLPGDPRVRLVLEVIE